MQTKSVIGKTLILLVFLVASCQTADPRSSEIKNEANVMPAATDIPEETSPVVASQTVNGVTITIDWVLADAKRVSFGYTIEGLPDAPDAANLFGTIELVEKSGTGELGWGGDSIINRVEDSPGTLTGAWSSIFAKPFTQPKAQFGLDITLGDDRAEYNINYTIAMFPFPVDATPYPPNVFPPKLPEHRIGDFHFDLETEIHPLLELAPGQSVTVNDVEMRLEKLDVTATFTSAVLCYQKPSSKDWTVGRSILRAGGQEAGNNAYSLIFDSDYGGYMGKSPLTENAVQLEAGRCVQVEYLLGHSNQPGVITLTIPALEQSIPEVIAEEEIAAAREKLLPQGIDMDWQVVDHGAGPVYRQLPEGMTEQEAFQLFMEALGYIYKGPWEFSVEVKP